MKTFAANVVVSCMGIWLLAGLLPALTNYRFLYADASAYLIEILHTKFFFFPCAGRKAAQVLDQWPAVLAINVGITDIRIVAYALGTGMMLMPLLFHGISISILLKKGYELAAVVYMLMLWMLNLYCNLMSVGEAHISAAVFLLALVMLMTDTPSGRTQWLLLCILGILSFNLYELWFFYAALLLFVIANKLMKTFFVMKCSERILALAAAALIAGSLTVNTIRMIAAPQNPNTAVFKDMLVGTTLPIYLVLICGWFMAFCAHLLIIGQVNAHWTKCLPGSKTRIILLLASLIAILTLSAWQHSTMVRYSYPFRILNLGLPLLFAAWLFLDQFRPVRALQPGTVVLLLTLTLFLLIYETRSTLGWKKYQEWEGLMAESHTKTAYVMKPIDCKTASTWIYPWTQSAQSFLAQALRGGVVRGIAWGAGEGNPYGPENEKIFRDIATRGEVRWE